MTTTAKQPGAEATDPQEEPQWAHCLYCQTVHWPFCGYSCLPVGATEEQRAAHRGCPDDPAPEDVAAQREWLGSEAGRAWLAAETA